MFFILSKLLVWFVYPLPLFCMGLLAILVFYYRRYTRRMLGLVLLLLYTLSTPLTVKPLVRWLEGPHPSQDALRQHYDVAIVLTGMVRLRFSRPGYVEFNDHVERILVGIRLVKEGIADKLLIVGGSGDLFNQHASEASILRAFALEFGLRDAQVLTEERSRNTYENAVKATELMRLGPYRDLVLITSALHMYRAAAAFHKQGLFPDLYPVDFYSRERSIHVFDFFPYAGILDLATQAIHELIGVVMYRLQGYI